MYYLTFVFKYFSFFALLIVLKENKHNNQISFLFFFFFIFIFAMRKTDVSHMTDSYHKFYNRFRKTHFWPKLREIKPIPDFLDQFTRSTSPRKFAKINFIESKIKDARFHTKCWAQSCVCEEEAQVHCVCEKEAQTWRKRIANAPSHLIQVASKCNVLFYWGLFLF